MVDVTIRVDEHTLRQARIRALEEGTSVNAVLSEYLKTYAGSNQERREAWEAIRALARHSGMSSGKGDLPKREELYDRPMPSRFSTGR